MPKPVGFDALTKEEFLHYAKMRKEMDALVPKSVQQSYSGHLSAYEIRKARQRELYAEKMKDPSFRDKLRVKQQQTNDRRRAKKAEEEAQKVQEPVVDDTPSSESESEESESESESEESESDEEPQKVSPQRLKPSFFLNGMNF